MTLADFPAVQQLTKEEKLQLVVDLWDDIAAQPDDLPISPEEIALLEERRAAHRANPNRTLTLEEFQRQLAGRL